MAIPTEPVGSIPRPQELIDAVAANAAGKLPDDQLAGLTDAAVRDTIQRFEDTGSPVISDGEQAKPSFLTYPLTGATNLAAGGVVLNKTSISPEAIIYPVVETTSPLSHLKGQTLEVEIRPNLPKLMADSHRLEQVLTNMVSNAIKYTPQGGSIKTVVSQQNGRIQFAVSDTGRGIPQEDLDKVFDPFYRVPLHSGDRTPGTGLGLALAKSLVELHGGEIWVESEPEKGSTFYFTVPIDSTN